MTTEQRPKRQVDPDIMRIWKIKRIAAKVRVLSEEVYGIIKEAPEEAWPYLFSVYKSNVDGILPEPPPK